MPGPGGCLVPAGAWSQGRGVPGPGGGGCLVPADAWWRPPRTATAASGTHPTGMHSCFVLHVHTEFTLNCIVREANDVPVV